MAGDARGAPAVHHRLQHPIGSFEPRRVLTTGDRDDAIEVIARFPRQLHAALRGLGEAQLAMPYRPGGWPVRTLVHHLADSHLIAYCWMKAARPSPDDSNWPTAFAYNPDALASLADDGLPVTASCRYWKVCTRAGLPCCAPSPALPGQRVATCIQKPAAARSNLRSRCMAGIAVITSRTFSPGAILMAGSRSGQQQNLRLSQDAGPNRE